MNKEYIDTQGKAPSHIGGQAVIEGVMMRGKNVYTLAVKNQAGEIETEINQINQDNYKKNMLKIPILRGVVSFIDSLIIGIKIISKSATMAGLDDSKPSKFEEFLTKKFGDKLNNIIMAITVVISILLSVGLFMVLPVFIGSIFNKIEFIQNNSWLLSVLEGFIRLFIFLMYIVIISKNKDIQRTFGYHGAEHKTINCHEHEEELTVENVKKYSRLHRRCGTSFLLFVMAISMLFFMFIKTNTFITRIFSRVLFVPLIAGISYEVLRFAGTSNSKIIQIISAPGINLQKITTKEPDDLQIACAIKAMQEVINHEK